MNDKLRKSPDNRVIAGVAGGLGEYFNIDPTIVRLIFVVLTIWGGLGILLYIILFIIMPDTERGTRPQASSPFPKHVDARHWIGGGLVLFGLVMLIDTLNNVYDFFPSLQIGPFVWPLVIIYLGIWFLYSQKSKN